MPTQRSEDEVLLQYLCFCENPLRDNGQIMLEYEELKSHPRVTSIAFRRPDVLMVGTNEIVLTEENRTKHLIGEFIPFLIRRKIGNYWEVDFRFWNVTNPLVNGESGTVYIHPHIRMNGGDKLLDCRNGSLCIQKGQYDVYQHIRRGEIHHAAPRLIEILETYPTGIAYHKAIHWPEWSNKNA